MTFFSQADRIDSAYGLFISIEDTAIFDELAKCDARKKVDVAIKYNGRTKEYSLGEFLTLHGFEQVNQSLNTDNKVAG